MDFIKTTDLGIQEHIHGPVDRIPKFDPRKGDHLWTMVCMYKVDPKKFKEGVEGILDHESLLTIAGPGCFYCEESYTPLLATRRCKGHYSGNH